MRVYLSSVGPPAGRCLLLAKQLFDSTGDRRSIEFAERLFDHQYPPDQPLAVVVKDREAFVKLHALCATFGVTCEPREP